MDVLAPVLAAVVSLVVGYLLGGFFERLRRKNSLIDDRLAAIRLAMIPVGRLRAVLLHGDRAQAVALYAENSGAIVIQEGIAAADALGAPATGIREALERLNSWAAKPGDKTELELSANLGLKVWQSTRRSGRSWSS